MIQKKILKGESLVEALRRKLIPSVKAPSAVRDVLSQKLGYSAIQIYNWQAKNTRVTANQVANLVEKSQKNAQRQAIQPIIEFFDFAASNERIAASGKAKKYKKFLLFRDGNKYELGVKEQLEQKTGVYIFYDSRGRALYVGKASEQSLWTEINNALNRARDVQRVRRVRHPTNSVIFKSSEEKRRQIQLIKTKLYEIAAYVSAYEVSQGVIGVFEAMLVRSFANDLLNTKMENFAQPKRKKKSAKKRRKVSQR